MQILFLKQFIIDDNEAVLYGIGVLTLLAFVYYLITKFIISKKEFNTTKLINSQLTNINASLLEKKKLIEEQNHQISLKNQELELLKQELSSQRNSLAEALKELQDSESRFANIFKNNSAVMIMGRTDDWQIIDANAASEAFYGYNRSNLVSMKLYDLNKLSKTELEAITKLQENKKVSRFNSTHHLNNGEKREVESHITLLNFSGTQHFFSIVVDQTERNKAEQALKDSEERLKEANNAKDKFFSIIAHDLKNPVQSLLLSSDMMVQYWEKIDDSVKRERIGQLKIQAARTSLLINQLLDWARSQRGVIEFNPNMISLEEVTLSNFELFLDYSVQKEVSLIADIEDEFYLWADFNMLHTVINNLISNAIKFSNKKGEVTVSAKKTIIDNNEFATITVADIGVGIEEDTLTNLFRIDVPHSSIGTSDERGTGLGLIIAKEFIEKHKIDEHTGNIKVESELGKGTKFIFTLPLHLPLEESIY